MLPEETGDAAGAGEVLGSADGAEEDGWQVSQYLMLPLSLLL